MLAHGVPNCSSVALSHCRLLSHAASPEQSPCLLQPGALRALEVWGGLRAVSWIHPGSLSFLPGRGSCRICFGVNHEFLEPQFP